MNQDQVTGRTGGSQLDAGSILATNPFLRYLVLGIGIILAALLMACATYGLTSMRGGVAPTISLALTPVTGVIYLLVTLTITTLLSGLIGRSINAVVGLFVLGCGLALLSMRSGAISSFVLGGGTPWSLVIEGVVWTLVILAATWVVFRISGPLPDIPVHDGRGRSGLGRWFSQRAWMAALAGLLVLPMVWLLLQNNLKGQALATGVIGSFAVGMAGRLISPATQPVLLFAAPVAAATIGYVFVAVTFIDDPVLALVQQQIPNFMKLMPLDIAAGSLIGVTLGFASAGGMVTIKSSTD